jgi:hypothetical protein
LKARHCFVLVLFLADDDPVDDVLRAVSDGGGDLQALDASS